MKIIFVRHGEPDYTHDSLTEKGWREANLLAERISRWHVSAFYCSPLGRAKDTASCTLKKMNRTAITLEWMREFSYVIDDPATGKHGVPWDFIPSYWTNEPLMLDPLQWVKSDVMKQNPQIAVKFSEVCDNFDRLLSSYGYRREKRYYRVLTAEGTEKRFSTATPLPGNPEYSKALEKDDKEPVIVIFCHLGITCVALSHLLNIPFPLLVHGFFLPTTSLTILSSEERWGDEAYFRVQAMGDVHHLLSKDEPISPAGSFANPFHQ